MRKAAYYLTLGAKIKAPENGDIRVVLTLYPPDRRQRDRDNLLSNCKAYLDGIADALGVNDSRFVPSIRMADETGGYVVAEITQPERAQAQAEQVKTRDAIWKRFL